MMKVEKVIALKLNKFKLSLLSYQI